MVYIVLDKEVSLQKKNIPMCIQNNYIMENHLMTSIKITKPNGQNNYLKQWQKANVLNWITMSHGYIYSLSDIIDKSPYTQFFSFSQSLAVHTTISQ